MHHIKNVTVIMRMYCVSLRLKKAYEADDLGDKLEKRVNES